MKNRTAPGILAVILSILMILTMLPLAASAAMLGDIDKDGKITTADARIALRISVGLETVENGSEEFLAGDVDGNGKIEAADARLILRAAVGLETLHSHSYTREEITKEATCKEAGVRTLFCECGDSITEEIPATGEHKWNDGEITTASTCKDEGVKTFTCTVCGETKTETVAKTGTHTWNDGEITTAATCKDEGVKTFTCTVCGETKTETVAKTGTHTWNDGEITTASTCKDEGVKTFTCTVCGETKTETVARTENHTWNDGEITAVPSCKDEGVKTFTCAVCGKTKTEAIARTETHTWNDGEITAVPSCKDEGVKTFTCAVCGKTKTEAIARTETHTWNDGEITTAATCTKEGVKTFTCTVCGAESTSAVPVDPTNHAGGTELKDAAEATCLEAGFTGKTVCKACGTVTDEGSEIPPKGHSYAEYTVPSTCQVAGYTCRKCSVCGDETDKTELPLSEEHNLILYTEEPSCLTDGYSVMKCAEEGCSFYQEDTLVTQTGTALGHDWQTAAPTPPTCTEKGYTRSTCSRCSAVEDNDFTDPVGHIPGAFTVKIPATCTEDGVKTSVCTVCSAEIEEVISAAGHNLTTRLVPGNCTIPKVKEQYCLNGCGYSDVIAEYGVEHRFGPPVQNKSKAPTCTEDGYNWKECINCHETTVEAVSATGHTSSAAATKKAATCTEDGFINYGGGSCTKCGTALADQEIVIPATGHQSDGAATCTTPEKCAKCQAILAPALGHDYKNDKNILGADLNTFYCSRCGEKNSDKAELLKTFNDLANGIKKSSFYNGRTTTKLAKTTLETQYSKFDFGIYTAAVKELYDSEMEGAETSYDPIRMNQSIFYYFPIQSTGTVSKLTENDIDSITVEKIHGANSSTLLAAFPDSYAIGSRTYDVAAYKNKVLNKDIIKVTIDVRDESMIKGSTDAGHLPAIYDYDIQEELTAYNSDWKLIETEGSKEDGYEIGMTMTLKKVTSDAKAVFYFDAETYNPIAATYDVSTAMDQDVDMKFDIGLFKLNGTIAPYITTEYSTVYLFSDYFAQ